MRSTVPKAGWRTECVTAVVPYSLWFLALLISSSGPCRRTSYVKRRGQERYSWNLWGHSSSELGFSAQQYWLGVATWISLRPSQQGCLNLTDMTAWFEAVCLVMMQPLWMKARQSQNMIAACLFFLQPVALSRFFDTRGVMRRDVNENNKPQQISSGKSRAGPSYTPSRSALEGLRHRI